VTGTFRIPSGSTVRTVTVNPGSQILVPVSARTILTAGQRVSGDVRLTYTGNPGDIVAQGMNVASSLHLAVPARAVEPTATDGRRLASSFFDLNSKDVAVVQLTNLSSSDVLAGARLQLADSIAEPLTSSLVTVPANGTATLNLAELLTEVPDGLAARGAVEVLHNGSLGALGASFYAQARASADVQVAALQSTSVVPSCYQLLSFPNHITVTPSSATPVSMLATSVVSTPQVSTPDGGSATALVTSATNVYTTTYTAPPTFTSAMRLISVDQATQTTYACGGTTFDPVALELSEKKPLVRLNPDGGTTITLTCKGTGQFPANVDMVVVFKQGTKQVTSVVITLNSPSSSITFQAPANLEFIGDVDSVRVEDAITGQRICKAKKIPFYYAFDAPSATLTPAPAQLNRAGGFVQITGSGFRTFGNTMPTVTIGEIPYHVREVSADGTTIYGSLQDALYDIAICSGSPCRRIKVTNPGGKTKDRVETVAPVFTLIAGPFPIPNGFLAGQPTTGETAGGIDTVIVGTNLWNLRSVTFGNHTIPYNQLQISGGDVEQIRVTVPQNCAGLADVVLADIDNAIPASQARVPGGFRYLPTHVEPATPGDSLDGIPLTVKYGKTFTSGGIYVAGPTECGVLLSLSANAGTIGTNNCGTWSATIQRVSDDATGTRYVVSVHLDASSCQVPVPASNYSGTFSFTLRTTETGADNRSIEIPYTIAQ
jgi:hypothetical protein